MVKAFLIDIDNTIYQYDPCHVYAIAQVQQHLKHSCFITESESERVLHLARRDTHMRLSGTASSHNRLLYFQNALELLNIDPVPLALILNEVYWNAFFSKMTIDTTFLNFLHKLNNKGIEIAFVTDLTADVQIRKLEYLIKGGYKYKLITSEEAGVEKPHPYIFLLALNKLKYTTDEVCMIGDDYKKDILGASNINIRTYWLKHSTCVLPVLPLNCKVIADFNEIDIDE